MTLPTLGDGGLTLPTLGDGGLTLPTPPSGLDAGIDDPNVPTVPTSPGSSSGSTTPTSGDDTGSTASGSAGVTASANANVGDAGLDAETAIAADGGCSTGGHGSGVTFLGVLGAAFAFVAARRRRTAG